MARRRTLIDGNIIFCNVIKSVGLRMVPKWQPAAYALDSCLFWIDAKFSSLHQARKIVTRAKM